MTGIVSAGLMIGGLFFILVGVIGIIRLPDFYARLHATSKCDTLGLALLVAGVAIHAGPTLTSLKLLLIAVFVAVVNATAAHAIGRAAYRSGLTPWRSPEGRHDD